MGLTDHERQVLARTATELKAEFSAERVILFGSAARGDMDRESDIDLMIVLPSVNWDTEKRIGNLAFDAGLEIGRLISTICFAASELVARPLRASPFVHSVRREGMVL
jgi:predicted nucleotidyltransferase